MLDHDTVPDVTLDQCRALDATPNVEPAVYMKAEADLTRDDFMSHQRSVATFYTARCMFTGKLGSFCPTCHEFHAKPQWWGECKPCHEDRNRKASAEEWA